MFSVALLRTRLSSIIIFKVRHCSLRQGVGGLCTQPAAGRWRTMYTTCGRALEDYAHNLWPALLNLETRAVDEIINHHQAKVPHNLRLGLAPYGCRWMAAVPSPLLLSVARATIRCYCRALTMVIRTLCTAMTRRRIAVPQHQ